MLHFRPCACAAGKMTRVQRSAWMRTLFPSRSLFHCESCDAKLLVTAAQVAEIGLRTQSLTLQTWMPAPAPAQPDAMSDALPQS